jgi:ATP-dependent exoDNAse (exonuclease V) alpha subunit
MGELGSRLPGDFILTPELENTFSLVEDNKTSVFVTGKAGTGKSTFIDYFKEHTKKNAVYLAPTGVAALNIRGKTIHSLFQFPPKIISKDEIKDNKYRKEVRELFTNIDTIVIDEISMARADIIDGIDFILKKFRGKEEPFGGAQMIFVGDLYQLPPVVSDKEKVMVTFDGKIHYEGTLQGYFEKIYRGQYFFNSRTFRNASFRFVEFENIFRQKGDQEFIDILNRIRENILSPDTLVKLNRRYIPGPASGIEGPWITLCTTNAKAKEINDHNLSELKTTMFSYEAEMSGEFETSYTDTEYPADRKLYLKVNTQVMMIKNDKDKRWVNGSMGLIKGLKKNEITIQIGECDYKVDKETWETVEYEFDEETKSVNTTVTGVFKQYPIKLAWAITIHKSQGKTFDNVKIDLENGAFAHGQTYVALSRCRTLEGIFLNKPIRKQDVILDPRVTEFFRQMKGKG